MTFLLFTGGLSFESNFGAIVRHRSMVLPFLFILISVPLGRGASLPSRPTEGRDAEPEGVGALPGRAGT